MSLKILHVIEGVDKNLGGQPTAMLSILNMEKINGFNSEVFSVTPPDNTFIANNHTQKFNLFPKSFPERFVNSYQGVQWLAKEINNYNLIVFHGIWTVLFYRAVKIARLNKIPYLIWPHGSLVPHDLKKKSLLKKILGGLFMKNALQQSSGICLTSSKEQTVFENYGARPETFVLPLPVSIPTGDNQVQQKKDNKNFVFTFIGRINYKKGIDVFLKAFKEVLPKYPNIKFEIWGTGDTEYEKYISNLIADEGLTGNSRLMGFLNFEQKLEVYDNSECFVLTSMYENFGIAPIEALQGGLPILISDEVFIWEDVKDAAWICKYDILSIVENLHKILTDQEMYNSKKQFARSVGNKYLSSNLKAQYLGLYSRFL